jgi:branched-chain amino acid transport system substrate-binding protein
MAITRRTLIKAGATAAAAAALPKPYVLAQSGPVKIGVLTVKSGVLASIGDGGLRAVQWAADRINAGGGILGRKVALIVEEESSPKDTVERFRKLYLRDNVDVVSGGISTGVGLSLGPAAEEMKKLWLSWDATTQKGVEETLPNARYAFRSTDNECEAIQAALMVVRHYKGKIKTVAGINTDFSYGRNVWDTFLAIAKKYDLGATVVSDLWVKVGTTDLTSYVAALQQAKPDLIFSSLLFADMPIFMKQAHAAGLTQSAKFAFPAAGFQHTKLEKSFTPEGMILGHNTMYFDQPNASSLLKEFVRDYEAKYGEPPHFESDRAYFTIAAYKAAVEKASKASGGRWPTTEEVAEALRGIEVDSLGGKVRYRRDQIPECNFYTGFTTHKGPYKFATVEKIETMHTDQLQKPPGADFFKWIETMDWKV